MVILKKDIAGVGKTGDIVNLPMNKGEEFVREETALRITKKMVVLKKDVEGLGRAGDVIEVARGYARNFLIPRGFAVSASRNNIKEILDIALKAKKKSERELSGAKEIADKISSESFVIEARAGEEGKLFGSVTNTMIAGAIKEKTGIEIDRKKIHIEDQIRELGYHQAKAHFLHDVEAVIHIKVVPGEAGEETESD